MHTLRRERCTYAIVTFFFAFSYFVRFAINKYNICEANHTFGEEMFYIGLWLIEGASMGVLMGFHYANFKHGSLLSANNTEQLQASIKLGEFHYFTDEEINTHNLMHLST